MREISAMLSMVGGVLGLLIIVCSIVAIPILFGRLILGPINHRAGRLKAPTRFQLSDFFWLVVQFQIVAAYCVQFVGIEYLDFFVLMFTFLTGAAIALWAGAVSYMSRAGVVSPVRRAVFILLLLPATLALMMTASFASLISLSMVQGLMTATYRSELEWFLRVLSVGREQLLFGMLLLPLAIYLLRRIAIWIVGPDSTWSPAPVAS